MKNQEIELRIIALSKESALMDEKNHVKGHCRWELGFDVFNKLESEYTIEPLRSLTELRFCMGYPVEINNQNPDVIKLWREVEV